MFSRRALFLGAALLIVVFGTCNSETLKTTYVSLFEKSIRPLTRFGRVLNQGITNIRQDLRELASGIPFVKEKMVNRNRTTIADILNPLKLKIRAIYPGTYWCGDGDISPNKKDLGLFERTDACCRAHDSCPDAILAQEQKDGLLNNGIFTRSSCECDIAFYDCLKEANSLIATNIGTTYFNFLRPQCFKKDYPVKGCKKYAGKRLLNDKCEEYIYDTTGPKTMEWFDNPDFFTL
ncbi:phospholipase A2-like [Calliopsis andreniformis]|uniref:phospholipase A2-like n=1 Tax=Calliopsis andreniformis TaxID=337506 RepID=UPI003FCD5AF8